MPEAAELAVFSFLCILDGVSAVESEPEKGELRLQYVRDGEVLRLKDAVDGLLHDTYNAVCHELPPAPSQRSEGRLYEVRSVSKLRKHQTYTDAMDLHVVSTTTQTAVENAPAISLPKNEHRKLQGARGGWTG